MPDAQQFSWPKGSHAGCPAGGRQVSGRLLPQPSPDRTRADHHASWPKAVSVAAQVLQRRIGEADGCGTRMTRVSDQGRGSVRTHPRSCLPITAALHRGQSQPRSGAAERAEGITSIQGTCGNGRSPARDSGMPHNVWLVAGRQACSSPDGMRIPSSSVHEPDAATAAERAAAMRRGYPGRRLVMHCAAGHLVVGGSACRAAAGWHNLSP